MIKKNDSLTLKNHLKEIRAEKKLSQSDLAQMVGVSRNTISSIETGQFCPTAKLALVICIALEKKFEEVFYFDSCEPFHNDHRGNSDSSQGTAD